jgi:cellulose synthase/poly-beta-1,6-N-acetylglucosamine synthase-like glycosyltransferase
MRKSPTLYCVILTVWLLLLATTAPALLSAVTSALHHSLVDGLLVVISTLFIAYFWLNGTKDLVYTLYYHLLHSAADLPHKAEWPRRYGVQNRPKVVMVYCTYNDFNAESLLASMEQNYPNCEVAILDDSTKPEYLAEVDIFAAQHGIQVVRRKDHEGFKAGNLNNYLRTADYDYFVILDSDEIVPRYFITRALDYFATDENIGIVQANHIATRNRNRFMRLFSIGVNSHWPAYQSVKHDCGFLSLLGHGAMVSRTCYDAAGGFPHVVAEDLCFSIEARRCGYYVAFAPDIICEEEYPVSYLAFKKRHSKWTQGNMEFIKRYTGRILRSPLTWFEKLDIVLFTYNLPLTAFFALYVVINVVLLPLLHYTVNYPAWLLLPTIAFLFAPMLNDLLTYRRTLSAPRLAWYALNTFILYGSMLFISLVSSLKALFGSSVFLVTPKSQAWVSWQGAVRANRGELGFGLVLLAIALTLDRSPFPVLLIVTPSLLSVYLSVFANSKPAVQPMHARASAPLPEAATALTSN